jgi:hypothetical protein
MKKVLLSIVLFCCVFATSSSAKNKEEELQEVDNSIVIDRISNNDIEITLPSVIFTFSEVNVKIKFKNPNQTKLLLNNNQIDFIINGQDQIITFVNGEGSFKHTFDTSKSLSIYTDDFSFKTTVTAYPMWVFFVPIGFIVLWLIRRMMKK